MGIIKCSLIECARNPIRYLILFFLFTIIFTGILVGLNVYSAADAAKNSALDTIGGYIWLEVNDLEENDETTRHYITEDMKKQILQIDHVKGVNQNSSDYAFPVDFGNVREHTGETPISDPSLYIDYENIRPYSIIIDANTDTSLIDDFRLGNAVLVSGSFPSGNQPGVVMEERLSAQNGLEIGDAIAISSAEVNDVKTVITGIYRTPGSFIITKDNALGDAIFAMSPYNRIYSSLDVGASLYNVDTERIPLHIYVDRPQKTEAVIDAILALDFGWSTDYAITNMTDFEYSVEGAQIDTMINYARIILLYVIIIGAILLSLVLTVNVRYYLHDAGILLALGASKKRVLLQYAISVAAVILLAFLASVIVSDIFAGNVTGRLISQTTSAYVATNSYSNGLDKNYDVNAQGLRIKDYFYFAGTTLLFLVFSCGLLGAQIARYRPRTILVNKRG